MTDDEKQIKHLELIQQVVSRLAGNSFSIKGWSITLVSALFALAAKDSNVRYAILALLPALCFWGLDAYYLQQERLFRKLYDAVLGNSAVVIPPFSMDTSAVKEKADSVFETARSGSVLFLHLPIVIAVSAVLLYAGIS